MSGVHPAGELLEGYRRRRLSPEELLQVDDHLARCPECRQLVGQATEPARAVADVRALLDAARAQGDHLSYEDLAAYVDGLPPGVERDIAEVHLRVCPLCAEEVRGLTSLKAASVPARRRPAAVLLPLAAALVLGLGLWATRDSRPERGDKSAAVPVDVASPTPAAPVTEPASTEAALVLSTGGETVRWRPTGDLSGLEWLPSRRQVADALLSGRLERPAVLAHMAPVEGRLLGDEDGGPRFSLLAPLGVVSRDAQPTLSWQPVPGAESYTVTVFDRQFREVARSGALISPRWRVATRLRRGEDYSWQVTAHLDGREVRSPRPPQPEARFRILDEPTEQELRLVETHEPRSPLALGVLFARAGLRREAEAELQTLLEANPGSSEAASLLASVRSWPKR